MTWTLTGHRTGTRTPGHLAWRDGRLFGDADSLAAVMELVAEGDVAVTPTGPFLEADLTDEVCAYVAALNVLSGNVEGDPPELPDYPNEAGVIYSP